jgi:hypothetical protein
VHIHECEVTEEVGLHSLFIVTKLPYDKLFNLWAWEMFSTEQVGLSSNALNLYQGFSQFEFQPGYLQTWLKFFTI